MTDPTPFSVDVGGADVPATSGLWLQVLASLADGLLVTEAEPLDQSGPRVVYVNPAFTRMTGFLGAEIFGATPWVQQGEATDRDVLNRLRAQLAAPTGPFRVELVNYRRDGTPFWAELSISTLWDSTGSPSHFVALQRDTTQRKRAEAEQAERLLHSPVTGLLNRTGFAAKVDQAIVDVSAQLPAVVLFDVQGLRYINHRYGRDLGDRVLMQVAARLTRIANGKAVVGHLTGGEFALLICESTPTEIVSLCERLRRVLLSPVVLPEAELALVVSGGVAIADPRSSAISLLREADVARRNALAAGPGEYEFYEPAMGRSLDRRLEIDQGLRGAVRDGGLLLHHQLIVDLATGLASHAEALMRWDRPGLGLISPSEFIPVAEDSGAILSIGGWVLSNACREAANWQDRLPGVGVSVNLSPRQLADPDLFDDVARALDQGLEPSLVMLEITESALVAAPEEAARTLSRLRALGLAIALDDFGTGYSSLAYLKRLPVDIVKIDKIFVDGVEQDSGDRAVIRSVLTLTSELGLSCVAEGVETQQQRNALLELGCQRAQGYLFARPQPADALAVAARHATDVAGTAFPE